MKTQTSIAARTYSLQEWTQMVQECNKCPLGMAVSEWNIYCSNGRFFEKVCILKN